MDDIDFFVPEERNLGQTIKPYKWGSQSDNCIVLSGFPYDEGTKRLGNTPEGALASYKFREALLSYEIYPPCPVRLFDAGDISKQLELEQAHQLLFEKHSQLLKQIESQSILFSIGGSHDQSYPNVRALLDCYPTSKIGVINIDSGLDVRQIINGKVHSDSSFRLMLQDPVFHSSESVFIDFGQQRRISQQEDVSFVEKHKTQVYWLEEEIRKHELEAGSTKKTQGGQLFQEVLARLQVRVDHILISVGLDVVNSKWMPGVSSPSVAIGLTNQEIIQIMELVGECSKVRIVELSEFNPGVESVMSSRVLVEMLFSVACSKFAQTKGDDTIMT